MRSTNETIPLTQYSHGSGCGCKVAPDILRSILDNISASPFYANLIVGHTHSDDAAVLKLNDELCLISTTDFFMPVVDDAFDFGAIAAANALSDVYAMGGKPILAIAILGWPVDSIPATVATQVINGAIDVCNDAGIPLAGGHTIDNKEPFFGLAVNGVVHIHHLKQNHTVENGNVIFLTKPIGAGIINTAIKRSLASAQSIAEVTASMKQLNRLGAIVSQHNYIKAITDVTGFGLIGHLLEMIKPNNLGAEIFYHNINFFSGAKELAAQFVYADNTMRNWKSFSEEVHGINGESLITLCDPQTSGGLLIAIDEHAVNTFKELLIENGLHRFVKPVARIKQHFEKRITVRYD
jgi:selenide,water dikinase